ncbi:MAG: hypothetical protein JXJ19_04920 [Elusimicrobia bacterium]|nr:hypothetical protein [Elusimicrobiota bacterium]
MIRRLLGILVCSAAVLLPWRLRCLYSEALGWTAQFVYYVYFRILSFILKEVSGNGKNNG